MKITTENDVDLTYVRDKDMQARKAGNSQHTVFFSFFFSSSARHMVTGNRILRQSVLGNSKSYFFSPGI